MKAICPVCDKDIEIGERDIKIAVQHKAETQGMNLVSCPECCRVLVLPNDLPVDGDQLRQWISENEDSDDWLGDLCNLKGIVASKPTGFIEELGVREYRPGSGSKPLPKRKYMLAYGINPACAQDKRGPEKTPFKTGD
jgi:hypothetical protein